MIISQHQAPATPAAGAGGHVVTEAAGHVFVSTIDPKPTGPWVLGREYAAKVNTDTPNAVLEILPDGPRHLVKVTPLDGGQHLIGGTYETEAGALVSAVPLGRQRHAQKPR